MTIMHRHNTNFVFKAGNTFGPSLGILSIFFLVVLIVGIRVRIFEWLHACFIAQSTKKRARGIASMRNSPHAAFMEKHSCVLISTLGA